MNEQLKHNSSYEKYPETGKIQKNLKKPEVLREIRKPEKIQKKSQNPEVFREIRKVWQPWIEEENSGSRFFAVYS
jgi:hypothetical protein